MRIFIEHLNTKRIIQGPFNICGSFNDLKRLRDALTDGLREGAEDQFNYGWINVTVEGTGVDPNFEATIKQKSIKLGVQADQWE